MLKDKRASVSVVLAVSEEMTQETRTALRRCIEKNLGALGVKLRNRNFVNYASGEGITCEVDYMMEDDLQADFTDQMLKIADALKAEGISGAFFGRASSTDFGSGGRVYVEYREWVFSVTSTQEIHLHSDLLSS